MDKFLPDIADRGQYATLFKQDSVWEPAIDFLIKGFPLP